MRSEVIAALFLMVGFFVSLAAWIWVVWPRTDPTSDAAYERRHQAHEPRR